MRVSHPYLGMGVAFDEMSDENRSRLRELLATITRPTVIMGPGNRVLPARRRTTGSGAPDLQSFRRPAGTHGIFENRQMFMREDFLRILRKSQTTETRG